MKIFEVSSAIDLVKKYPGGKEIMQYLHQHYQLGHDQEYQEVAKVSWQQLKDWSRGAWVILTSDTGAAGIRLTSRGQYVIITWSASTNQIEQHQYYNLIDVNAVLKANIGKPKHFFVGRETGATKAKQDKRSPDVTPDEISIKQLVTKFKPIWARAVEQAIADTKGMVANMLKNDAYHKLERKIHILNNLKTLQNVIQDDEPRAMEAITPVVQRAVVMAASYYYPDLTGQITSHRWRSEIQAEKQEGVKQLLSDIQSGDTAKLGGVLAFFKRGLTS